MEGCIIFKDENIEKEFYEEIKHSLQNGILRSEKICLLFVGRSNDGDDETGDCKQTLGQNQEGSGENNIVRIYTKQNAPTSLESEFFDNTEFMKNLKTLELGNVLVFLKLVTSTMDVAHLLYRYVPNRLVVIAERQRSGRGRGGTTWESPLGCGMFTFNVSYAERSKLGRKPSFLGYITSCSVVKAVQFLTKGMVNLRLKWPNDIYGGAQNKEKIGGTLHDLIPGGVVIGVGVNMSNDRPTISLNNLIKDHNNKTSEPLHTINIDQFIATFLNIFEEVFQQFQNNESENKLVEELTQSWIHNNVVYSNQIDAPNKPSYDVIFKGIDEQGLLLLQKVSDKSEESLSPRGMSVDVINNILHRKPGLQ